MKKKLCLLLLFAFVMVMPITAEAVTGSDVVNVAKAEVGISGRPNKYTIWYSGNTSSYEWCHAFVSWCANQAGAGNLIPKTTYCPNGVQWFKARGQWKTKSSGYTPKPGDIIYFDYHDGNPEYDHVGIVDYVSSGRVHTIEGNARDTVKLDGGYNGYALSDSKISGYGVPAYDAEIFFDFWGFDNTTVSGDAKIWWKESGYGTCDVNLSLDGKAIGTIYPDSNGLFSYVLHTIGYNNGQHTLSAIIRSTSGAEKTVQKTINIQNTKFFDFWGLNDTNISDETKIWLKQSGYGVCSVELSIDGKTLVTFKKSDENGLFSYVLNPTQFSAGTHVLSAKITSASAGEKTVQKSIKTSDATHFRSYIDTDTDYISKKIGKISGLNGELFIQGWAVDKNGIDHVEYEILESGEQAGNETAVKGTCTHRDRADVQQAYPNYAKGKEGFMANIPYSQLKWGHYYPEEVKIVLTAYCKGGQKHHIGEIKVGRQFSEKTAPVISNVKVKDITYKGYTVTATVTDASGIARVQFPTWTMKNGQDDILKDWGINSKASGTISGNTVTFHVNVSDHNGETGTYKTHIYAYDKNGNYAVASDAPLASIEVPAYVKSTGVVLNTSSVVLKKGESKNLTATVSPSNTTDKTITWETGDAKVATVSSAGVVKAVDGGKTTVTATTADGKSASCTIQVTVNVTGVTLDKDNLTLKGKGSTSKLVPSIQPANATNKAVTWTTTNDQVATVSNDGVVTSVGKGEAVITVATKDGSMTAKCSVKVTIPVSSISLDKKTITLTKNMPTDVLTEIVTPEDASNKEVTWSSEDEGVAAVENGKVTAIGNGTTLITAMTKDGSKTASCVVNVDLSETEQYALTYRANGGEQEPAEELYASGQTAKVSAIIPVRSGYSFAGWGFSPDASEVVYRPGDAIVMDHAVTLFAIWQEKIEGIELSASELDMHYIGQTARLTAYTQPGDKVCADIAWSSDNTNVADVAENGVVTAKGSGKAVITAKTIDERYTASCSISVVIPVESVSIDRTSYLFTEQGESADLVARVLPENATNKRVLWTSSDSGVATVNEDGRVTAVGNGNAIVQVTTVDGGKTDTCSIVVSYEEKCSHVWGEYTVINAPTCYDPGTEAIQCTLCGEIKEDSLRDIPSPGHTYEEMYTVPATCEEDGYTKFICTVCGNLETEELAAGHTPGEWEVVKEATVDEEGERVQKCTVCETVIATEKIPKLEGPQTPTTLSSPAIGTQLTDQKSGGVYSVSVAGISGQAEVEYRAPYNKKIAVVNVPDNVVINNVSYKVTSIAANAFKNSKTLRKVTIGRNIVTIGAAAFSGCKKLSSVILGENVASIGSKAFCKCTALKKLTVPASVKKIGAKAFYGCGKLKRITFKTTKLTTKKVGSKAFAKIYKRAVAKVPKKVFKSYKKMLRKKGISSGAVIKK